MGSPEADLHRQLLDEALADSKDEFISQKADELYAGEFSPDTEENFAEFLGNMPPQLVSELKAAIDGNRGDECMAILADGAAEYWKQSAKGCVERRVAAGYYEGGRA